MIKWWDIDVGLFLFSKMFWNIIFLIIISQLHTCHLKKNLNSCKTAAPTNTIPAFWTAFCYAMKVPTLSSLTSSLSSLKEISSPNLMKTALLSMRTAPLSAAPMPTLSLFQFKKKMFRSNPTEEIDVQKIYLRMSAQPSKQHFLRFYQAKKMRWKK